MQQTILTRSSGESVCCCREIKVLCGVDGGGTSHAVVYVHVFMQKFQEFQCVSYDKLLLDYLFRLQTTSFQFTC